MVDGLPFRDDLSDVLADDGPLRNGSDCHNIEPHSPNRSKFIRTDWLLFVYFIGVDVLVADAIYRHIDLLDVVRPIAAVNQLFAVLHAFRVYCVHEPLLELCYLFH